jgi:insulysin
MFGFRFVLLVAAWGVLADEAPAYREVKDTGDLPILSPAFADRKTDKLILANELQVYIISDPKAEKSAAALVVETGNWQDLKDAPGTAHFTEHLLFVGNEKYPGEGDYSGFLTQNGGTDNGTTNTLETTYMFSVNTPAFPEALDRLSQSFKKPLFKSLDTARHAIDQEFLGDKESDWWRQYQVTRALSNPESPNRNFGIGNISTLSKLSQEQMMDWYQKHYSANLMHLVVYSSLPIDQLKSLVVEDFSDIQDRNLPRFKSEINFTDSKYNGNFIYITPLKNVRQLTVTWEMPKKFVQMINSQPDLFVAYVLGDQGPNSLIANLKKNQLAESLDLNKLRFSPDDETFSITIGLTEKGLKQVNTVIQELFAAISNFKKKGVPKYLFDDIQTMQKIGYQYPSQAKAFDMVTGYAKLIPYEDLASFPQKSLVISQFDRKAVNEFLDTLTPSNAQYYILANPNEIGVKNDLIEPWMQVPYSIKPIPQKDLKAWALAKDPNIHLLPNNIYVPENLKLVNPVRKENASPHPITIVNDEKGVLYYSPDELYLMPQVYCSFTIKTPQVDDGNPRSAVLADLYQTAITEALKTTSYPALIGGLNGSIKTDNYAITVAIDGYNDKASLFFEEILKKLKTTKPSQEAFVLYKDRLLRGYQNFDKGLSLAVANQMTASILTQGSSTNKDKAKAIANITYKDFIDFTAKLFEQTYVEGLIYGNVTKEQALGFWNNLGATLSSKAFPKEKRKEINMVELPQNKGPFYFLFDENSQGNAAVLCINAPQFSFKNFAAQQILSLTMNDSFFDELRNKQQTGYIVSSGIKESKQHLYNYFMDLSYTNDPVDLLARFEVFIDSSLQKMDIILSAKQFEAIRQTVIGTLSAPPKNLKDMGEKLNILAFQYGGDFDFIAKEIKGAKELTREECIKFANETLGKDNKKRFAILIRGNIPLQTKFDYTQLKTLSDLKKISEYK